MRHGHFQVSASPPSMTDDERRGAAWWNALTVVARRFWLDEANRLDVDGNASPADAWREYKRAKRSAS